MRLETDGKTITKQITVEIEISAKEIWGRFEWRKRLGLLMFKIGVHILRCNLEVKTL